MTVLALALLLLTATAPMLALPLRRAFADPTLVVAGSTVVLLALAALAAAEVAGGEDGWRAAAALVLGISAATGGGSDVVRATFRLIRGERHVRRRRRPVRADAGEGTVVSDTPDSTGFDGTEPGRDRHLEPSLESVLRGGAWIGYLERAAISATLLAGWPEGMALVLAVKGVGRYPELKEPSPNAKNAPEAFIIGTLVSVLWAAAAAGTARLLTR